MRIRGKSSPMNSVSASSTSSSSSSLLSHSSITIASSTDSSSSPTTRCCTGLDLLVKAICHVTSGSAVAVPYIQRRVIRRRRRALRFNNLVIAQLLEQDQEDEEEEEPQRPDSNLGMERQRRGMDLPTKFQDSVLQSWRPRTRLRRP